MTLHGQSDQQIIQSEQPSAKLTSQPCSRTITKSCTFEDGSRHYIVLLSILVALLNRLICTIQELFPRVAYGLPANLAVSGGKGQV